MRTFLLAGAAMAVATVAVAAPIPFTHSTSNGISYKTNEISEFNTGGDDMDGLLVTAFFGGGGSETVSFLSGVIGDDAGAASGTGWSLTFTGPTTFSGTWTLATTDVRLTGLLLEGQPGKTVFDYIRSPDTTPGSESGGPGSPNGPDSVDSSFAGLEADFRYSNRVALGTTFFGDLFERLRITFNGAMGAGNTFSFVTDTDNAVGDIILVPEPAAIGLFGLGLLAVGVARRRRAA
jgi:hypothetical protein